MSALPPQRHGIATQFVLQMIKSMNEVYNESLQINTFPEQTAYVICCHITASACHKKTNHIS